MERVLDFLEGLSLGAKAAFFFAFLAFVISYVIKKKLALDKYMIGTLLLITLSQILEVFSLICEVTLSLSAARIGVF